MSVDSINLGMINNSQKVNFTAKNVINEKPNEVKETSSPKSKALLYTALMALAATGIYLATRGKSKPEITEKVFSDGRKFVREMTKDKKTLTLYDKDGKVLKTLTKNLSDELGYLNRNIKTYTYNEQGNKIKVLREIKSGPKFLKSVRGHGMTYEEFHKLKNPYQGTKYEITYDNAGRITSYNAITEGGMRTFKYDEKTGKLIEAKNVSPYHNEGKPYIQNINYDKEGNFKSFTCGDTTSTKRSEVMNLIDEDMNVYKINNKGQVVIDKSIKL